MKCTSYHLSKIKIYNHKKTMYIQYLKFISRLNINRNILFLYVYYIKLYVEVVIKEMKHIQVVLND